MDSNMYLRTVLNKYAPGNVSSYQFEINKLLAILKAWASSCYIEILTSGSRAKGTAISIASDIDYMVSLSSSCNENNGGLKSIYDSLYSRLRAEYGNVRKQNVSFRINIGNLEIDITPARKHKGNTNNHWLYVSKQQTWKQTNIQKHIVDVSNCNRLDEIKLLKIWRELHQLDFPSIYLEYLTINILSGKSTLSDRLSDNFWHLILELSKDTGNPLYQRIVDPANSTNILSDLLTQTEKSAIINQAKISKQKEFWNQIVW
jgi:hypothetical protein